MNARSIIALSLIPGIGRKTINKIVSSFLEPSLVERTEDDLYQIVVNLSRTNRRIKPPDEEGFDLLLKRAENILAEHENKGITVITIADDNYPDRFRAIDDPPAILYAAGNIRLLSSDNTNIAVVGSRNATEHGKKVAQRLGEVLAGKRCCVVSGLALGCDRHGHIGALAGNGPTIAILPSPLDNIVPESNRELAKEIVDNEGLLLSEYPAGTRVDNGNYVDRDRLQSALSDAVIVVETTLDGGTMHTAKYCNKYNRILACYDNEAAYTDIKAIEGNIELIKSGKAIPVRGSEDLDHLIQEAKLLH